ncbi:aldo/keto reductase [Deinococcus peraridilitoris]|uniref:Putative oxidoreductase, aryl-alcohol dehydrogenase like protein n=1 Tax=Deinococcus peraridilitoris (strain DSM 19664 / LMG 22246 / CIP 109416 / KR-200) TaxID=937777 RepID=L0A250_DEIPD|nr:aldo/keto reductase [Deinococcus peraridilitoris]AFZ67247.1 putative oxidoreductase, aryl-alcohol dehydrogenase like protein [Deinococcus peraridilitoris DSM 19664]
MTITQRNLGPSGLQVSLTGLGCNNFGGRLNLDQSREVVHAALDEGITLFDTADVYGNRGGSEEILGELLEGERERVVLATKFALPMNDEGTKQGASRRYILQALHASLKRLRTDHIDLYQLHRPDPHTPIEETLRALGDLIRQGMVRYIGCSNLPAWQVMDAHWTARSLGLEGFISCQDEYSLLVRDPQRELLPAMQHLGLGLLPYFPLASGLLTGKYQRGQPLPEGARLTTTPRLADRVLTDENWQTVENLRAFAEDRGHSLLDLAFSWLAANPQVSSIIAGATSAEQVRQNVRAASWTLTPEDLTEIQRITTPQPA